MSRIRANQITNQSADGAPTVQNGLIISGVTTSTTFSGSGASLTNLPAQATIANNADNRVITGGSGVNLNGEANLTFDGNTLALDSSTGTINVSRNSRTLTLEGNYGNEGHPAIKTSSGHDLRIFTSGNNERLRINSNGSVGINTTAPENNSNDVSLHIHGSANDDCRIAFSTPTKSNPGSRIGYFGLNRFGIDTYDGLEIRDVTASYATRFKIDQNGYMTNNQPYGHLRFNVKNDTGGLAIQTDVNTADVQNGMSHNGSGRLTVPASGKYMIMLACNLYDDSPMQFRMMKNGSDLPGGYYQQNDSNIYWKSGMRSIIVPLSANDYIESRIQGKQDSHVWNHLTVYMLG